MEEEEEEEARLGSGPERPVAFSQDVCATIPVDDKPIGPASAQLF